MYELTLAETRALLAVGQEPEAYIGLDINMSLGIDEAQGMSSPDGMDVVIIPSAVVLPRAMFRTTRLLDRDGRAPNPAAGIMPVIAARVVIRRETLAEGMLTGKPPPLRSPPPAPPDSD